MNTHPEPELDEPAAIAQLLVDYAAALADFRNGDDSAAAFQQLLIDDLRDIIVFATAHADGTLTDRQLEQFRHLWDGVTDAENVWTDDHSYDIPDKVRSTLLNTISICCSYRASVFLLDVFPVADPATSTHLSIMLRYRPLLTRHPAAVAEATRGNWSWLPTKQQYDLPHDVTELTGLGSLYRQLHAAAVLLDSDPLRARVASELAADDPERHASWDDLLNTAAALTPAT
jgi:hypothetical protein